VVFLKNIMVSAVKALGHIARLQRIITYLRTQGKALRTEMMMNMFVMMPLAITAGC
jgi:hypothetical protein